MIKGIIIVGFDTCYIAAFVYGVSNTWTPSTQGWEGRSNIHITCKRRINVGPAMVPGNEILFLGYNLKHCFSRRFTVVIT